MSEFVPLTPAGFGAVRQVLHAERTLPAVSSGARGEADARVTRRERVLLGGRRGGGDARQDDRS